MVLVQLEQVAFWEPNAPVPDIVVVFLWDSVGLKMNLLDPTLAIDLQYLGVRLPIPPPGVSLEPPPPQGLFLHAALPR